MTIGLQICLPPRPDVAASYALRVPQAGDLLIASFRPHLTVTALAVQLTVPVIRVHRGLAPPSECALPGAQTRKAGKLNALRPWVFPMLMLLFWYLPLDLRASIEAPCSKLQGNFDPQGTIVILIAR